MTAVDCEGGAATTRDWAFRWLMRASSVSMLGSHVTTIAYPLLVLRLTGSPLEAGWVAFAAMAPSILVHIPAGALVDRWNPGRAMLVSEIGRGVAIATVAITLWLGWASVLLLTAAAVLEGVLEVFSVLAERRCIGSLVGPGKVSSALVRIEGRTHVALVAGRALGGLLFGIRPILPFLTDVASFVFSVGTIVRLKKRFPAWDEVATGDAPRPASRLGNDIREGMRRLRKDRFACLAIFLFSFGTLIFQALIIVFLADANNQKLPAPVIGVVLATSGTGGVLGAVAASRYSGRVSYSWIRIHWIRIQISIWLAGFAFLAFVPVRPVPLIASIMAILGFTGALGNIQLDTHLMRNYENGMLARVTSISRLLSFGACAIGPALGGMLVQAVGIRDALHYMFFVTPGLLVLAVVFGADPARAKLGRVKSGDRSPVRSETPTPERALQTSSAAATSGVAGVGLFPSSRGLPADLHPAPVDDYGAVVLGGLEERGAVLAPD